MTLHRKKQIVWTVTILLLLVLAAGPLLPTHLRRFWLVVFVVLLAAEAVLCLCLLRCPHCHGQIHLWGQSYCPTCGEKIDS